VPFATVKRPNKHNKSKTVTLRLTDKERADFERLKKDLEFQSVRDLVLFSTGVLQKLYEWNCMSYHFYIGNPAEKDYKEVEFELKPNIDETERR